MYIMTISHPSRDNGRGRRDSKRSKYNMEPTRGKGESSVVAQLMLPFRGTGCVFQLSHLTPNGHFSGRAATLTSRRCIFKFIQQIYVLNILNMLHTLRFCSSKCRLFHNATFFFSFCIIHILYTVVLKFESKFRRQSVNYRPITLYPSLIINFLLNTKFID